MERIQKEYVHLKVDNALNLIRFLGKDIKELNIPEESIQYMGEHPFSVFYDTSLLGQSCNSVTLEFTNDYASKTDKAQAVYITCSNTKFWECKAYLDSQIGECHDCGTQPYAAANGGAKTYLIYYKDGVKYDLSMGSANSYYSLVLSLGEPKNPPSRQSLGILNPESMGGGMVSGMGVGMPNGMMAGMGAGMSFGMSSGMGTGMASGTASGMAAGMSSGAASAQPAANKEAWICPECGRKNFGKFCEGCGKMREL